MSFKEQTEQKLDLEDIPCQQNSSQIDVSQYFRSNKYLETLETKEEIYKKLQKYKQGSQKLINERKLLKNLIVEQELQILSLRDQIESYKQKVQEQLKEIENLKLKSEQHNIYMETTNNHKIDSNNQEISLMDLNQSWHTEQLSKVQLNDKQIVSDQVLHFLDKLDSVQTNRDQELQKRDLIISNKYEELNKKQEEIFNKEINDLKNKVKNQKEKNSQLKLQLQQNQHAYIQNDMMVEQINVYKKNYEELKDKYKKLKQQFQQNKQIYLQDELIEGIKKEYQDMNKRFLPGVMTEYVNTLSQKLQELQSKCDQQINEIKVKNNELESINFETQKQFNKNFDIQIFRQIKEDLNQKIQDQNQISFKFKEMLNQQENEFQSRIDAYDNQRQQFKQEQQQIIQQKDHNIQSKEFENKELLFKIEEISQQLKQSQDDIEIYKENQQNQEQKLQIYDQYFDFFKSKFQFTEKQKNQKNNIGIRQEGPLLPLMLDFIQNYKNDANIIKQDIYFPHKYKVFQLNYDFDKLKNIAMLDNIPQFEQVIQISDQNINYLTLNSTFQWYILYKTQVIKNIFMLKKQSHILKSILKTIFYTSIRQNTSLIINPKDFI